jgi:hypothetical protein
MMNRDQLLQGLEATAGLNDIPHVIEVQRRHAKPATCAECERLRFQVARLESQLALARTSFSDLRKIIDDINESAKAIKPFKL